MSYSPESVEAPYTEFHPDTRSSFNQDQAILQKISKFMEMKNIPIAQFWQSDRKHASPQDIQKFCQSCGMSLSIRDKTVLKAEIFTNNRQVISIYQMCHIVNFWKQNNQERISSFLKQRSEVFIQEINSKNKKNNRVAISAAINRNRNSPMATPNRSTPKKIFNPTTYIPNNSHKYLHRYREKISLNEQKLTETIEKTKNQEEYSMLIKMNEVNEWNKKGKSPISYRPFKNAEGIIRVRVFNIDKMERELSLKEFDSEYKICRKGNKQNKQWEQIPSHYSNKREMSPNLMKNIKKEERQQELKNLLTNTVNLTNLLREQIKIFKMRGIYGCENIL